MTARSDLAVRGIDRKRRAHRKSRQGCGNCKLRRVKCDEGKPSCNKCLEYGVNCSYKDKVSELQLSGEASFNMMEPGPMQTMVSSQPTLLNVLNGAFTSFPEEFQLRESDLPTLDRFQKRTILTMGTPRSAVMYREEVMKLIGSQPALVHIALSMTLLHDRYLENGSAAHDTAILFHWNKATAMFNNLLSKPVRPDDRDALWAMSALLGCITTSYLETQSPEESWPLTAPSTFDLNWLQMSRGKHAIWKLVNPMRPDSVFRALRKEMGEDPTLKWLAVPDFDTLPPGFRTLFNLGAKSSRENNPYHTNAVILARILPLECTHHTILAFISFISYMSPTFQWLLEQKDARALLLMAYWFAKVSTSQSWWLTPRAKLECQAICLYLERYHWQNVTIRSLLEYPRFTVGLKTKGLFGALPEWSTPPQEPIPSK